MPSLISYIDYAYKVVVVDLQYLNHSISNSLVSWDRISLSKTVRENESDKHLSLAIAAWWFLHLKAFKDA